MARSDGGKDYGVLECAKIYESVQVLNQHMTLLFTKGNWKESYKNILLDPVETRIYSQQI